MTTLASLLINLGIDTRDYEKGIDQTTHKTSGLAGMLGSALGGIGTVAGIALTAGVAAIGAGVAGLAAGVGVAIKEGMEAESGMAELDAVLQSTATNFENIGSAIPQVSVEAAKALQDIASENADTIQKINNQAAEQTSELQGRIGEIHDSFASSQLEREQKLNQDIQESQENLQERLTDLKGRHQEKLSSIQEEIDASEADYAEGQKDRQEELLYRLSSLADQHKDRLASIQEQIDASEADNIEGQVDRQERLQEQISDTQERYGDKREDLQKKLNKATTDDHKALIQQQIADLDLEEKKAIEKMTAKAAKEEEKTKKRHEKQLVMYQKRLADEEGEYKKQQERLEAETAKEEEKTKKRHEKQLVMYQKRLADEEGEYKKQQERMERDAAKHENKFRLQCDRETEIAKAAQNKQVKNVQKALKEIEQERKDALKKAAKDYEEANQKLQEKFTPIDLGLVALQTQIQPTRDALLQLADSLAGVTTFEDDAVVLTESLLLTFTNIGADVFPQATEAVLNLAQKFGSLESAGQQIGKALQDPIAGVGALRKVGVMLSDEQENQIKQFMAVGDVASAQAIILGELETEFGGLARTMKGTLAGQFKSFKNDMLDVAETVGMSLIPALKQAFQTVTPYILEMATNLASFVESDKFKDWIAGVVKWLKDELPVAIETAKDWFTNTLIPAMKEVWKWISENLVPTLKEVWKWLQEELPAAIQTMKDYWTNTLQPALKETWSFIKDNVIPIFEDIKVLFSVTLPAAIADLRKKWDEDFLGIRTFVETTWDIIQNIEDLFNFAKTGDWYSFGEELRKTAENFMNGVSGVIEERIKYIKDLFFGEKGLKNQDWLSIGNSIMAGIGLGMWNAMTGLAKDIYGIGQAIINVFLGFFDGHSPSRLMQRLVRGSLGGGMGLGFEGIATDIPLLMRPLTPALASIPATTAARGGGGGGNFTLEWHDHSVFRLADRYEMERLLGPTIEAKFRELLAKGK